MKENAFLMGLLALAVVVDACREKEEGATDNPSSDTLTAGADADSVEEEEMSDSLILFEDAPLPETADEVFDDFFFNFATNRDFQQARVADKLTVSEGGIRKEVDAIRWNVAQAFPSTDLYAVIFERNDELELEKDTALKDVDIEVAHLEERIIETFRFRKQGKQWKLTEVENEDFDNSPNGDFLTFYAHFSSDSAFQVQSLSNPLPFVLSSQGEAGDGGLEQMSADEWSEQDMPLPVGKLVNIVYGQSYISQTRKSMQIRDIGGVILRYNFEKGPSGWRLVSLEQ